MREKLSRRLKKKLLGNKISRKKLRILLQTYKVFPNKYPESSTIEPFEFCPKCGCTEYYFTNNMATYPEQWIEYYCYRCDNLVASVDNSPFIHVLEEMADQ